MQQRRVHGIVCGLVQGVGFRAFCRSRAQELLLSGWVRNLSDGSVEFEAQGPQGALEHFFSALRQGPAGSSVHSLCISTLVFRDNEHGFRIR
jgi:acylphosphatase